MLGLEMSLSEVVYYMRVMLKALDNLLSCMQGWNLPPPANTTSGKHESLIPYSNSYIM